MYDLMKALEEGLKELCSENGRSASYQFTGGFLDHSLCSANFMLHDNDLAEYYKGYLTKMGYEKRINFILWLGSHPQTLGYVVQTSHLF